MNRLQQYQPLAAFNNLQRENHLKLSPLSPLENSPRWLFWVAHSMNEKYGSKQTNRFLCRKTVKLKLFLEKAQKRHSGEFLDINYMGPIYIIWESLQSRSLQVDLLQVPINLLRRRRITYELNIIRPLAPKFNLIKIRINFRFIILARVQ